MSRAIKSVGYIVGFSALGAALFFFTTPSSASETFKKMDQNQGTLIKDRNDAEKNTHNLMSKLKQEAGIGVDKKS